MVNKILAGLLLVVVAFVMVQSFRERSLVSGQPPAIIAKVFNQNKLLDVSGKSPSLIYFWASWCGICKSIQGTMQTLLQQYPGITVAMQSGNEQNVRQYLRAQKLDWPFVVDEQGQISDEYGVPGVPAIFILDGNGQIRYTAVGYSSIWGLKLRLWLADFE